MKFASLKIDRKASVATVWMNCPERHNAFDAQLIEDLTNALRALDGDQDVRVVILAGVGKNFSAGADLGWMNRQPTGISKTISTGKRLAEMLRLLADMRQPTIARVQGAAFAAWAPPRLRYLRGDAVGELRDLGSPLRPDSATISPYVLRAMARDKPSAISRCGSHCRPARPRNRARA